MAGNTIASSVRSTHLEQNLGKTIMGRYISELDSCLLQTLQQKGDNVAIPTLSFFLSKQPKLEQEYINLYNAYMGLVGGVENIPDSLKASQGALFDGLCFGYDTSDDSFALYTMNFSLLMDMEVNKVDMAKQCIEKNKKGEIKGYRIDIEYEQSPESFTFKAVNHRKPIDDDSNVLLVPYIAVVRLMKMMESFLNSGSVLKTKQLVGGTEKVRCISKNMRVLSNYCDNPEAPSAVQPTFFPLKAFFYAPVLGAPSTTSMVTNINLFALSEVKKLANAEGIKKLGIEKPEDPMRTVISEPIVIAKLLALRNDNPMKFIEVIDSLPRSTELFVGVNDIEGYSSANISKYLHSLTNSEQNSVISLVPDVKEEVDNRLGLFKSGRKMTDEEKSNMRHTLRNNICKFIIRKKDCSLSSITCTNSPALLRKIYGENYFAKYEGFSIRMDEVLEELSQGRNLREALEANGFEYSEDLQEKISLMLKENEEVNNYSEALTQVMANSSGVKTRARSSSSNIMVRTLNAYISEEGGVQDYYRYLDEDKIIDAMILS